MSPRRLLVAIPELDAGGPDRVIFELLSGLDRSRFDPVLAVSRPGGRYFGLLGDSVSVRLLDDRRYPVRSFARAVDELAPDVILTTLRMNVTATAARFIQRRRPSLIIRQANAIAADFAQLRQTSLIKHRVAEHVIRALYRRADVVVAQSDDMARELVRDLGSSRVVKTIGNPVDVADIAATAALPSPMPGKPALIAVGRLAPQKGFDLLLPAFAAFRRSHPEAELTILGEGPQRADLEALRRELGLIDAVHLPGQSSEVVRAIAGADILVSSSRYEGFSNVLLEAMAAGTPVVATACPGATRSLVVEGHAGVLAEPESIPSLAEALERMMAADRTSLAGTARAMVAERFDRRAIVAAYEDLFEQAVTMR